MSYLSTSRYKKEDFIKLSWEEYGKSLEELFKKVNKYVKKNNIKINAVVPILRGGAFPGTYLSPWESLDEEWTTVQGKQFPYKDLEEVRKISESKVIMENE